MDQLKQLQIKNIMAHATSALSTSSSEEEQDQKPKSRRQSAAADERWQQNISMNSLGPSIWGSQPQERGRASRSASFSVGQELSSQAFNTAPIHEKQEEAAYDQTRLLREKFQQMRFKNRSKSSYAAAWHVPDLDDDDGSEDAIVDEDEALSRVYRRGEPPGLRYSTNPTIAIPRLDSLRREQRSSMSSPLANELGSGEMPRSPRAHQEALSSLGNGGPSSRPSSSRHASFSSGLAPPSPEGQISMPGPEKDAYGNLMADVDRYFSSDDHRTRTRTHLLQTAAAQSALLNQPSQPALNGPLYIVEFKACRTDVFYVAEGSGLEVHPGDLVIVEADRGRDLGKVTRENVSMAQVKSLKAQQAREQALAIGGNGEDTEKFNSGIVQPKLIYRLAQPSEVAMLLVKSQDEQQAMLVCQAKVRQRKLPMEVLDGEYQWDRRKLTFYYYASQRIDFRELVRDLFKIYKTRIWMCAVDPAATSNLNTTLGAPGAIGEPKNGVHGPNGSSLQGGMIYAGQQFVPGMSINAGMLPDPRDASKIAQAQAQAQQAQAQAQAQARAQAQVHAQVQAQAQAQYGQYTNYAPYPPYMGSYAAY